MRSLIPNEAKKFNQPPAGGLSVYLLGPPRVEWLGQPWPISRRQARGLLFRLAAEPNALPREHLVFLFWPDTPEAVARRNLTRLLTHLRRALPAPDLLLANDDCVGLDPVRTWSDAAAFTGRAAASAQTVALYRGPFLAGFSLPACTEFEAWSQQERAALERRYLAALEELIEDRAAHGAYAEAIDAAQRYLATDELAEQVQRRLAPVRAVRGCSGARAGCQPLA